MKHSFDFLRDVCIYCHAPRYRVEETQSMECPNNKPFRDWIVGRGAVFMRAPIFIGPSDA